MKENLKLIKTEAENYYQSHSVGNSLSNISKKHSELINLSKVINKIGMTVLGHTDYFCHTDYFFVIVNNEVKTLLPLHKIQIYDYCQECN